MNDLLNDSPVTSTDSKAYAAFDIEDGRGDQAQQSGDVRMQNFFNEVGEIKSDMQRIKKNLHKLQDANEESKHVTRAPAMKDLKQRMEADINEVTKVAHGIKNKIEALDRANVTARSQPGCGEGSSNDRTRMSITNTLKKKLKELMNDFQELRSKFQDEYREVVERRYYTVTGKRPDENTVEHLIETGESESIFAKAIHEQGRNQIMDTMAEIQERHTAVREIEKQLLDLHQVFMDMAVLVESQGELLDNIEVQVGTAVDHVQQGTKLLVKARASQRSTRRWLFCGLIATAIVIAIIVVVIVKPWK